MSLFLKVNVLRVLTLNLELQLPPASVVALCMEMAILPLLLDFQTTFLSFRPASARWLYRFFFIFMFMYISYPNTIFRLSFLFWTPNTYFVSAWFNWKTFRFFFLCYCCILTPILLFFLYKFKHCARSRGINNRISTATLTVNWI